MTPIRPKIDRAQKAEEKRKQLIKAVCNKLPRLKGRHDQLQKLIVDFGETLSAVQWEKQQQTPETVVLEERERSRVETTHERARKAAEAQVHYIRKMLAVINRVNESHFSEKLKNTAVARHALMQTLVDQAKCLPLYVSAPGDFPPPLVGAIGVEDDEPIAGGHWAAAYVDENWILAQVIKVHEANTYDVRDVDADGHQRVRLSRRCLIPLPKYRADPAVDTHALFPVDAWVLALYPQTTCFYKGIVHRVPATATDDYLVAFDDATYESGFSPPLAIPQRYVVAFRVVDQQDCQVAQPPKRRKYNRKKKETAAKTPPPEDEKCPENDEPNAEEKMPETTAAEASILPEGIEEEIEEVEEAEEEKEEKEEIVQVVVEAAVEMPEDSHCFKKNVKRCKKAQRRKRKVSSDESED